MVNKHLQKNITAKAEQNQEPNSSESPSNFGRGKLRAKGKAPSVVVETQNPVPASVEDTVAETAQVDPTLLETIANDSSDSETENAPVYEAVETPSAKKRGRPLGSKDRPRQEGDKPRGRPLGTKDRVPEPGEVVKKRGRPRKHPQLVTSDQNATSSLLGAATSMFSFINSPLGLDGSVGVIWNSDGSISASGKRRGRPLGSKNKTKAEHDIDDATGSISSDKKRATEEENEAGEGGEEGENQENVYDPITGELKRKLGRPRGSRDKTKRARWGSKVTKLGDEGDEGMYTILQYSCKNSLFKV